MPDSRGSPAFFGSGSDARSICWIGRPDLLRWEECLGGVAAGISAGLWKSTVADHSLRVPRRSWLSLNRRICHALIGGLMVCQTLDTTVVCAHETVRPSSIGEKPSQPSLGNSKHQSAGRTFLRDGIAMEIVAAAPLVTHPVHMEFDHRGRLWVVEGNFDNSAGTSRRPGTQGAAARIVTLTDNDNDGRMDARIVFDDQLDLPASIVVQPSGVYVSQIEGLIWLQDLDGDGRSDTRTPIASIESEPANRFGDAPLQDRWLAPPIFANLDNWIYCPSQGLRIRATPGRAGHWTQEHLPAGWNTLLGHDEAGRLIHASTGGWFRFESVPHRFLNRNPNHKPETSAVSVPDKIPIDSQPTQADSTHKATAASRDATRVGSTVYRGDLLPAQYRNALFACDSVHGMIRQYRVTPDTEPIGAKTEGEPALFLSLGDDDFTPVQLQNGPDGALYIADIGSAFPMKLLDARSPRGAAKRARPFAGARSTGRILRIAPASKASRATPRLANVPSLWEITPRFTGDNGFWNEAAQRWMVEHESSKSARILEQWVSDHQRLVGNQESTPAPIRLRALWTLEGQGRLTSEILRIAMDDPDTTVRSAALQITADQPPGPIREGALAWVLQRSAAFPRATHPSLLACLGSAKTTQADGVMRAVLLSNPISVLLEDAALGGLAGRELSFLKQLITDPNCGPAQDRHAHWVERLAGCIRASGDATDLEQAVDLVSRLPETDWKVSALLAGLAGPPSSNAGGTMEGQHPLHRPSSPPSGLTALRRMQNPQIREWVRRLELRHRWTQPP